MRVVYVDCFFVPTYAMIVTIKMCRQPDTTVNFPKLEYCRSETNRKEKNYEITNRAKMNSLICEVDPTIIVGRVLLVRGRTWGRLETSIDFRPHVKFCLGPSKPDKSFFCWTPFLCGANEYRRTGLARQIGGHLF